MSKPRLADARRLAGLTQQQLADRVGLNRVQLAKYESGVQSPSVATAARIAKALDTPIEELFEATRRNGPPARDHTTRIQQLETRLADLEKRFAAVEIQPTAAKSRRRRRVVG